MIMHLRAKAHAQPLNYNGYVYIWVSEGIPRKNIEFGMLLKPRQKNIASERFVGIFSWGLTNIPN